VSTCSHQRPPTLERRDDTGEPERQQQKLLPPYVLVGHLVGVDAQPLSSRPASAASPQSRCRSVPARVSLGASSGCLIIIVVLSWADAISVLFFVAAIAAIGAACFGIARLMSAESGPPRLAFHVLGRRGRPFILAVALGLVAFGDAAIQPTTPSETGLGRTRRSGRNRDHLAY
jgi:hypothetical protein